jgi:hypothetical protein
MEHVEKNSKIRVTDWLDSSQVSINISPEPVNHVGKHPLALYSSVKNFKFMICS